ncbi:hypothetical protein ACTXT7_017562 [Hymenolepis weldensis]
MTPKSDLGMHKEPKDFPSHEIRAGVQIEKPLSRLNHHGNCGTLLRSRKFYYDRLVMQQDSCNGTFHVPGHIWPHK